MPVHICSISSLAEKLSLSCKPPHWKAVACMCLVMLSTPFQHSNMEHMVLAKHKLIRIYLMEKILLLKYCFIKILMFKSN